MTAPFPYMWLELDIEVSIRGGGLAAQSSTSQHKHVICHPTLMEAITLSYSQSPSALAGLRYLVQKSTRTICDTEHWSCHEKPNISSRRWTRGIILGNADTIPKYFKYTGAGRCSYLGICHAFLRSRSMAGIPIFSWRTQILIQK